MIGRAGRAALSVLRSQFATSSWLTDWYRMLRCTEQLTRTFSMTKKTPTSELIVIPVERITQQIYLIRGQKVMFDADLAALYQVPTKVLNQAVRRNRAR